MPLLPTLDEDGEEKTNKSFYDRLPNLLPKSEEVDSYEFNMAKEIRYFGTIAFVFALILIIFLFLQK
jgi:hypothetical protein